MKNCANLHIQKMGTYTPPIEGRRAYTGCLLDFNERTLPASKKVTAALQKIIKQNQFQIYPEYGDIASCIAAYVKRSPEELMVTNGSDQGIDLIFRTFTEKGGRVIIPSPSFAMFDQCAGVLGNRVIRPLYKEDGSFPLEEVLEILGGRQKIQLVVICNPNNPTGTLINLADLERILNEAQKSETMVYVDEAYGEFSGVSAMPIVSEYSNLIITKTFSKAFGLSALRIGYCIAKAENINELKKVRGPYDVNMFGWAAARAALEDKKSMQRYVDEVMQKAKPMVEDFFKKKGISFLPSAANFILFRPQTPEQTFEILKSRGMLTRPRKGFGIEGTLRVSIGTVAQMKRFISLYPTL